MLVGQFMAFDRHMNIVLGDTEEYRRLKTKKGTGISEEKEEKRTLGLIVLRGDSVVRLVLGLGTGLGAVRARNGVRVRVKS
jgi:small nuclear ribonucleoprotein B and B'